VNCAAWCLAFAFLAAGCTRHEKLLVDRELLPADGVSTFRFSLPVAVSEGSAHVRLETPTLARTTIMPGRIVVSSREGRLILTTTLLDADSAHDGTPDFLRLDAPADQDAFRQWFTFLAEAQFFRRSLPREISDCAALIRYSYREALSIHNDAWIASARLPILPSIPAVSKYSYPHTPLAANLFRIQAGEFRASDISDGTFAQFADAETLLGFNAHPVSRDIGQARPGDILWYHQLSHQMAFHTMVFLGQSQMDHTRGPYVVYHTGPDAHADSAGEIRRVTVNELLAHPDPQWRPIDANANFLGIYRWNIL
jgi:uncharacterized protein